MVNIMKSIKDIDKEHNGYVTSTELDDIIKLFCIFSFTFPIKDTIFIVVNLKPSTTN